MAFDPAILGLPVELTKIPSQLKALWEGDSRTRASLLNFVMYCRDPAAFGAGTELLSRLVRHHACRAILLGDCPPTNGPKISAWVQAHCHVTKAGAREICSEQISIFAEGISQQGVANVLLSNLDYDLPLSLWWQGDFPQDPASPLWARVDCLLFDSLAWSDPAENLRRLDAIRAHASPCMGLADLNWTRILRFRQALAESFDSPTLLTELHKVSRVRISHGAQARSTGLLLAAWLAAQLHWIFEGTSGANLLFRSPEGSPVECALEAGASSPLEAVWMSTAAVEVCVRKEAGTPLLLATLQSAATHTSAHFPAMNPEHEALLIEELTTGSRHRVYLKALEVFHVLSNSAQP